MNTTYTHFSDFTGFHLHSTLCEIPQRKGGRGYEVSDLCKSPLILTWLRVICSGCHVCSDSWLEVSQSSWKASLWSMIRQSSRWWSWPSCLASRGIWWYGLRSTSRMTHSTCNHSGSSQGCLESLKPAKKLKSLPSCIMSWKFDLPHKGPLSFLGNAGRRIQRQWTSWSLQVWSRCCFC